MDSVKSRSLDWKTCFKKILSPHLLDASNMEDQNDAPHPSYAFGGEEQKGEQDNTVNLKNDRVTIITYPKNSENVRKNLLTKTKISSTNTKAVGRNNRLQLCIEAFRHCRFSDLAGTDSKDSEDDDEEKEEIAKIIAADAEELAENFKKLKFKEKNKTTPKPPKRKRVFKKVPDPAYFFEPSEKPSTYFALTSEEYDEEKERSDEELRRVVLERYEKLKKVIERAAEEKYNDEKEGSGAERRCLLLEMCNERKKAIERAAQEKEQRRRHHFFDGKSRYTGRAKRPPIIPSECWDDDMFY